MSYLNYEGNRIFYKETGTRLYKDLVENHSDTKEAVH